MRELTKEEQQKILLGLKKALKEINELKNKVLSLEMELSQVKGEDPVGDEDLENMNLDDFLES